MIKASKANVLYRSESQKMLAGVAGGLAEYFKVDPSLVRIAFVIAGFFSGFGVIMYLLMWVILPTESKVGKSSEANIRSNVDEIKAKAVDLKDQITKSGKKKVNKGRQWLGIAVLAIGLVFLLRNFGFYAPKFLWRLWPIFLIVLGLSLWQKN